MLRLRVILSAAADAIVVRHVRTVDRYVLRMLR
jgi:hypothetical protein